MYATEELIIDKITQLFRAHEITKQRISLQHKHIKTLIRLATVKSSADNIKEKASLLAELASIIIEEEKKISTIYRTLTNQRNEATQYKGELQQLPASKRTKEFIRDIDSFIHHIERRLKEVDVVAFSLNPLRDIYRHWQHAEHATIAPAMPGLTPSAPSLSSRTENVFVAGNKGHFSSDVSATLAIINPTHMQATNGDSIIAELVQIKSQLLQESCDHERIAQLLQLEQRYENLIQHERNLCAEMIQFRQDLIAPLTNDESRLFPIKIELAKIVKQRQLLHDIENILLRKRCQVNQYQLVPSATSFVAAESNESEITQLQQRADELHNEIANLPEQYLLNFRQKVRHSFISVLPKKIHALQQQLDELNCQIDIRLQNTIYAYQQHFNLRRQQQGEATAGLSDGSLLQARLQIIMQRLRDKQALLQSAAAQLAAQRAWLIDLYSRFPTKQEIEQLQHDLEQSTKHQQTLQHRIESCRQQWEANKDSCHNVLSYRQELWQIRLALDRELQNLADAIKQFGDFSNDEIELLREQQIQSNPQLKFSLIKTSEFFAIKQQILERRMQLIQEREKMVALDSQLSKHQIWLHGANLATSLDLNKLNARIEKIQKALRGEVTGFLSEVALQKNLHAIKAMVVNPEQNTHGQRVLELNNKMLARYMREYHDHQEVLRAAKHELIEILNHLGGDFTQQQLMERPFNLQRQVAEGILHLRQQVVQQLGVLAHLQRQSDELKQTIADKNQDLNAEQRRQVSNKQTQIAPEGTPHLQQSNIRSFVEANRIQNDPIIYFSQTGLPVEASTRYVRFQPQAHLAPENRTPIAKENVYNYKPINEADTIRQMVDQSIDNKWGPVKISGGVLPGSNNPYRLIMIACGRAQAQGIGVDWDFLRTTVFKSEQELQAFKNDKDYQQIVHHEQQILEHERHSTFAVMAPASHQISEHSMRMGV